MALAVQIQLQCTTCQLASCMAAMMTNDLVHNDGLAGAHCWESQGQGHGGKSIDSDCTEFCTNPSCRCLTPGVITDGTATSWKTLHHVSCTLFQCCKRDAEMVPDGCANDVACDTQRVAIYDLGEDSPSHTWRASATDRCLTLPPNHVIQLSLIVDNAQGSIHSQALGPCLPLSPTTV